MRAFRLMVLTAPLLAPWSANAQEAPTADVIVEAQKQPEPLSQVPASIQVISGARIDADDIRSLDRLGESLPNIVLNRRQDNEPNVVVRGIGGFGNVQGVGFYLDDVQNFTDQSAAIEDVDRIEVLKGPQGVFYGGSNIGGAIKYVLKQPTGDWDVVARVGYGSFGTLDTFATIDAPLDDTLAVRLSGYARRTDGYVANTTLGGNADRAHEDGGRAVLAWTPRSDAKIVIELRHNVLDDGGNIYVRVPDATTYRRDVGYNQPAYNDRTVTGGSIAGTFGFGRDTLTLLSSYAERSNLFLWDLDYSAADALALTNGDRHHTRVVTQEARLTSPVDDEVHWLVGAYYSEVIDRSQAIDLNVLLGRLDGGPRTIVGYSNGETDEQQYALFGNLSVDPGRWRFDLGARLNRSEFVGLILGPMVRRSDVDGTLLLPRLSVGYQLDRMLAYASLTTGAEPGRTNVQLASGLPYHAEHAVSGEIGIKGKAAADRIGYSLAVFYTDDRDRQFETLFADAGVLTEQITNIGRSISYGAELDVTAAIGRLTLGLDAGYLQAHWRDRDARFDLMPIDGLRVPYAPVASASARAAYRQPIGSGLAITAHADIDVTSGFEWDIPNTARQPAYTLLNGGLILDTASGRWSLAVNAANLGDARYNTEFVPNLFGPGQSLAAPSRPRTVMATLTLHR